MQSLETVEKGSMRGQDTKRFRLRAVSNETEVYERYFNKSVGKKVSWIQLGTAGFTLLAQMTVMVILIDRYEYYASGAYLGTGIWSSMAIIFSSVMTLWAAGKPSYGKLHASMAFHIISVLAQIFLVLILFTSGIPDLRRSIRSIHRGDYNDYYGTPYNLYEVHGDNRREGHNATDLHQNESYNKSQESKEEVSSVLRQLNAAFVLNAMMSFAGILQILMSFFMSLLTGRAICCGRTHLEGRFLEMETVVREDADAVVNFRLGRNKERQSVSALPTPTAPEIITSRTDSVGPPPYDTSFGFFGTAQSSETIP